MIKICSLMTSFSPLLFKFIHSLQSQPLSDKSQRLYSIQSPPPPPPPPRGRSLEAPISSCLPELCSRRILSLPCSSPALGCHPTSGFCSVSLLLQQLRSSQPLRAVPRSWKGPRGQNPTSGWDSLPQTPLPPHSRLTLRDADVGLLPAVSRRVDNSCELCSVAAPAPHRDIIFAFV